MKSSDTPGPLLQILEHIQVLRLDRDVQVGGRLVGDNQLRRSRQGDRADDAWRIPPLIWCGNSRI